MKIDNAYKPALTPISNRPLPQPADVGQSGTEAVVLSSAANSLHSSNQPPVNAARIQEIKDAIAQGRFKINPEVIADGLIESARDLINSQRKA